MFHLERVRVSLSKNVPSNRIQYIQSISIFMLYSTALNILCFLQHNLYSNDANLLRSKYKNTSGEIFKIIIKSTAQKCARCKL